MRSLIRILSAAGLVLGLALAAAPAQSQTKSAAAVTAAAIAAAKELLSDEDTSRRCMPMPCRQWWSNPRTN